MPVADPDAGGAEPAGAVLPNGDTLPGWVVAGVDAPGTETGWTPLGWPAGGAVAALAASDGGSATAAAVAPTAAAAATPAPTATAEGPADRPLAVGGAPATAGAPTGGCPVVIVVWFAVVLLMTVVL